jgi:hypothetical protein
LPQSVPCPVNSHKFSAIRQIPGQGTNVPAI